MSIYKPSLLDKFKDFVNGLRGNADILESQQQWINSRYQTVTGDVLSWALTCDEGITSFFAAEPISNVPTPTYSLGFVLKTQQTLTHIFMINRQNGDVYINSYNINQNTWFGWKKINMTAV